MKRRGNARGVSSALDFKTQFGLNFDNEIIVDLFAGGGGASTGIEMALGRPVDVAINHDPDAVSMHTANHPHAKHYVSDVYEVDPHEAVDGRPVGHLHASPDCTHFSQAKGGQSRKRAIRSLSWVVTKWAGMVRPRVISLENVEQILQWSPLVAKRCKDTGRVITLDMVECPKTGRMVNRVADRGERVPVDNQYLVPDRRRRGHNWQHFVESLRRLGYAVQWRTLKASSYGAPTRRERLYLIARCDGKPIVWPEATYSAKPLKNQQRYRPAAECIDFSLPSQSIFTRKKPLADATMKRIAKGIDRFVLNAAEPFIVPIANYGSGSAIVQDVNEPLRTITAWPKGGSFAVASPTLIQTGYGERTGQAPRALDIQAPLGTVVAGGVKHALASSVMIQAGHGEGKPGGVKRWGSGCKSVEDPMNTVTASGSGGQSIATAFMAQMNGGYNTTPGHELTRPTSTVTNTGSQQQLVTAHMVTQRNNMFGSGADAPLNAITAGGLHHGLVECKLSPEHEEGALRVAAFLMHYYSTGGQWGELDKPLGTITTKDRLALVTVMVKGTPYVIVDICLRMLVPRELYRANGFPDSYIIDHGHDGRKFTKSKQVKFVGNSVSPLPMMAIVAAQHGVSIANDNRPPRAEAVTA